MSKNSDSVYLQHILEAINNIEASIKGVQGEGFNQNVQLQAAILHFIQIVGEAVKFLSPKLKEKYPEVAWSQIAGMRNKVVHEYFQVDLDVVWDTVTNDVPSFKVQVEKILKELQEGVKTPAH
jgi:uncharacterized protein with HEPN domain